MPDVIYIPTCGSRLFSGSDKQAPSLRDTILSVLNKAGLTVQIPEDLDEECCGQPFASKGLVDLAQRKGESLLAKLSLWSQKGRIPILMDASPCALQLDKAKDEEVALTIYESAEFIERFVLDKLAIQPVKHSVALHITCSSKRRKSESALLTIAKRCAEQVVVPSEIECCGFAGDKGLFYPQLNQHGLRTLKDAVKTCQAGYSNSLTCEIGLTQHSGIQYQSIFYLLDQVSY
jgi:D-lactate dehydrogenase